jgi:outer membrane protein TolC
MFTPTQSFRVGLALSVALLCAFLATNPHAAAGPSAQGPSDLAALTLEKAVDLAMARDERVQASKAEAEAVEQRRVRARAFFFPDVTLAGTYTRRPRQTVRQIGDSQIVIQKYNALAALATLNLPIFDARFFPIYRQARLAGEAAGFSAAEERRLVGFEAADAFLLVLGTQEIVRAAERRLEFARDGLRDAEARAEAGLVSVNDVTRSRLEVDNAARELVVLRNDARVARHELEHLLVAPITGPLVAPAGFLARAADAEPADESVLVDESLRDRLDIEASRLGVQALEAAADEPALRAVPALNLLGQGRYTNEAGLTGRTVDGNVSVVATWPVWDGGERTAETREREALARAAALDHERAKRDVSLEVRRALASLRAAQETQGFASDAARTAARNASETAELYRQGLSGSLEVADANLSLFEAEVAVARDRYALGLAFLDLAAARGEGPERATSASGVTPDTAKTPRKN